MLIYIVRHAWAYHHGDSRWPDDSQRPLEPKGAKRFQRVMRQLTKFGFDPAVVATSPYLRCRQTADIVADYSPGLPAVVELDALTPGSDFDALVDWTRRQEGESVCWVGHAPDVGRLASALVSDEAANLRFAKGSVAAIRVDGQLGRDSGELCWLTTAKLLGV
jgi:phosphohistidine phosphatase